MPKEINSNNCFKIFKDKGIEMCIIHTNTRINTLDPSFTIAKSDSCIEGGIFDVCIEQLALKGIIPCNDEEHIF